MNLLFAGTFRIAVAILCGCATIVAYGADLPSGAKILDSDVLLYSWPSPTVSPDGKWLAYVSQGYVCVLDIPNAAAKRLKEIPNSWTHVIAGHGKRDFGLEMREEVTSTMYGFNWAHDSEGFVFSVLTYDSGSKEMDISIWFMSVVGEQALLAHSDRASLMPSTVGGVRTRDGRFVVMPRLGERPLIWDVAANKPRATCFLVLSPSPKSGRWIGIEKDTRQLVITDESFNVVRRIEEFVPTLVTGGTGLQLTWSPDEKYLLWRQKIGFDHFSNWEGFRLNLETGDKRPLSGRFMDEEFAFTGRSGELLRWGQTGEKTRGYDAVVGAHMTLIPDGDGDARDVWRYDVGQNDRMPGGTHDLPLVPAPNFDVFAVGLPRVGGDVYGYVWHLMRRDGTIWRLPGADTGTFVSPYQVIGFADGGKKLIAHDQRQIFSLPVSVIMVDANLVR